MSKKSGKVPSKEIRDAMKDWSFANGQYVRALRQGRKIEAEGWRLLMVKAGEKLR